MQVPLLSKESKGAEIQYFLLFAIFLLFIFGDHVRDAFVSDDKALRNRQSSPQGRVEIPLSTGMEVLQRYPEIYRLCQENAETLFRADPSRGLDVPVEVTFLEALAVGKYGAIVKASGNGEIFALKILKLQPDDMDKGEREVMVQHYLSTHHVEEVPKIKFGVKVHKLDLYERRYKGFAMELFAHPTLLDYLATTVQYLSVPDRLQLIRGQGFLRNTYITILRAIQKIWARGVVHGDLHARNILWDAQNNQTRIIDFGEARLPFKNQQKKYQLGIVEDLSRYTMGFVSSILFPKFALERRLNEIPQDEIFHIQQVSEELCPAMREIRDGYFPRVESFQRVLEYWREQQDIHPMAKVAPSREKVRDTGLLILDKPDWNTADSPQISIEESIGKFDKNFQDDRVRMDSAVGVGGNTNNDQSPQAGLSGSQSQPPTASGEPSSPEIGPNIENQPTQNVAEGPYDWKPLISMYINTWSMVMWDRNKPYKLNDDPIVPKSNCQGKLDCREYCKKASTGKLTEDISDFCGHSTGCWDTSKMACWRYMGGCPVWDGKKMWTQRLHRRTEEDANDHAFMILTRPEEREVAYMFGPGGGKGREVEELCSRMRERDLARMIGNIPNDFTVYIMGHSEGSGWSMCMDQLMMANEQPNRRVLLASGPRMLPRDMLASLSASPRPFLFLQSGIQEMQDTKPTMFDLFTFQRWKPAHYISPPSVAFICRQVQHPKSMKKLDICYFPEKVNLMEEMELRLYPNRVAEVHNFDFYRECLELCIFTTFNQQHFRFSPNTLPYHQKT